MFIAILHSFYKPSIDGATVDTIHISEVFDSLRCRMIFKTDFLLQIKIEDDKLLF